MLPLADVFFARSQIQKEILDQMKTERKPEFINKLCRRHGATLTSAFSTQQRHWPEPEGAGHPVAQYTSAGRATRKFGPDLLSLADIEIEVGKHKPDDVKILTRLLRPTVMLLMQ